VQEYLDQLNANQERLKRVEAEKEHYLALKFVGNADKHKLRRDIAELASRMAKVYRFKQ
jgi:hypothetical protein